MAIKKAPSRAKKAASKKASTGGPKRSSSSAKKKAKKAAAPKAGASKAKKSANAKRTNGKKEKPMSTRAAMTAKKTTTAKSAKKRPTERRDATGHLLPRYAADLRRRSGKTNGRGPAAAFVKGPHTNDDLAEQLGEDFLESVTTGEDGVEETHDREVPEERGGPFVITSARTEFAKGTDASNPRGSRREPFPRT